MNRSTVPGGALTLIYVAFIALPLAALVIRAVSSASLWDSLTGDITLAALRLSLLTSLISMIIVVGAGIPIARYLSRRSGPAARVTDVLIDVPLVLPPVVAGLAMLMAFGRMGILGGPLDAAGIRLPFTTTAVILAQVFVSAPFFIRAAKLGFQAVPRELDEISQTLGVSPWRTFWRVSAPLAWPSLVGGLALSWARAISEFGATIMFAGNLTGRTQTMPLAILSAMESDVGAALALAVILVAASIIVLLVLALAAARAAVPAGRLECVPAGGFNTRSARSRWTSPGTLSPEPSPYSTAPPARANLSPFAPSPALSDPTRDTSNWTARSSLTTPPASGPRHTAAASASCHRNTPCSPISRWPPTSPTARTTPPPSHAPTNSQTRLTSTTYRIAASGNCPAGNVSASPLRAHWRPSRASSSLTSRSPPSTPNSAAPSARKFARSSPRPACL